MKNNQEQPAMSAGELREFFQANADTYTFLSQMMFKELTAEAIEELAAQEWPRETGNTRLDLGYKLLRRYFKFSEGDRRSQLACEYARVFLAAGIYGMDKKVACPYESIFTSDDHNVMGESRSEVVRIFKEHGFQVDPGLHEPEDHLSFEFEFLATMNQRAVALVEDCNLRGLKRNIAAQVQFIDNHLLNWVPDLLIMAQEFAKLSFYLGMLNVAIGSLEQTRLVLKEAWESAPDALREVHGAA